ncbi:lysine--tRNA ligase, partial [Angustibacter luteus]
MQVRRAKRERLLASGVEPYPVGVPRTHTLAEVRAAHPDLEPGAETDDVVGVTGRVVFVRNTGKLCFATLQEGDGTRLQAMLSLAEVGEERLAEWKSDVDLGDHVFVHGKVISSRRGELSIMADAWQLAAKALRPLPNLHEGAELNEEVRVRQRYADLIVRPAAREMVRNRAAVVRSLRDTFHARGFIEVETPMLQTQHGGAAARPFSTHMNAYDMELFLRIAPELFLKRAAVGGLEKVFEINRNFRNEGADSTHSPEFAMLEFYEAYGDYNTVADLTQVLVQNACEVVHGSQTAVLHDGTEYDFSGDWTSLTMYGSLSEALGEQVTAQTSVTQLREYADKL